MISISVCTGLHAQLKAGTVNAALYSSPEILGKLLEAGEKAMKLGDDQCVRPGMIFSSISLWKFDHGSPLVGGLSGRRGARFPGVTADVTRRAGRES